MGNNPQKKKKFQCYMEVHQQFRKEGKDRIHIQNIQFPLSTRKAMIVDSQGRRVKLYGANWSGPHMCRFCVGGLESRKLSDICYQLKNIFKLNCIRLTFSLQLFFKNPKVQEKYLKANPELIGKSAMQIFDITIEQLTKAGLMVYLNNHTSTSMWCCSEKDGDGLWWTKQYPEFKFYQCLLVFAQRYKKNQRVIGMDLRNQIRKANGISPTWGDNNYKTDWKRPAEYIANQILKIAPHWLIIIGGLDYQLDLTDIQKHPIQLKVPNKLVYSGHVYGFSWYKPWKLTSYQDFKKRLYKKQVHVRMLDGGTPFIFGQFGNNCRDTFWQYMIRFLQQYDLDWTYWCLDGFKCDPSQDQTYGLYTNNFKKIRNQGMMSDLQKIMDQYS